MPWLAMPLCQQVHLDHDTFKFLGVKEHTIILTFVLRLEVDHWTGIDICHAHESSVKQNYQ